ncbi:MAG: 30S ribosomal protein S17 [Alphaproteobacteria bacterium]|nr:30S ribosomal protein S17 [Alphaproteobacteria bacterium]
MPKRIMQGAVVSDQGDKTVVVSIERVFTHPLLKKTMRRSNRFHAHDEANKYKVGDWVQIQECSPKSKLKRWEVIGLSSKG